MGYSSTSKLIKKLRLSFQLPLRAGITAWISAKKQFLVFG